MNKLLYILFLLSAGLAFSQSAPELTNNLATNIDAADERQAWREALEIWTDDAVVFGGLTLAVDLPITEGGTGASTAGGALTNLGVSAFGQTLIDDASAGAALTTLGVSAYAQTILDDATAAAAATTLGLGTGDSPTFTGGTYTGNLFIGGKLNVGSGAADDGHIVNFVSEEDVATEVMLHLEWNSPTPLAGDSNALLFSMYDSALNETEYSRFRSVIEDPTDGSEDGAMTVDVLNNGVLEQAVLFSHDEIIMNDNGSDRNFIVKDNTTAEVLRITGGTGSIAMDGSTLFVDSANNRVGVGESAPDYPLHLKGTGTSNGVAFGVHASDDTTRFEILDNGTWQSKNSGGSVKAYYDPTQYGGAGLLNMTGGRIWCSQILVPSGAMQFGTGGANTSDISFNSNGAVAFKIEGTTGDLEIGTANSLTFASNSGTWDGATIAGAQTFSNDATISSKLILDTNGGSGTEGIIAIDDGYGAPTLIQQTGGDIITFTDANDNGSHDAYETIYLNYSLGGGGLGLGGTDAYNAAVFVGTNYLYMGSGLTIYNPFTVAGQVEMTGQSASSDDSAMTRGLVDTDRWLTSSRIWSPNYAFAFANSGTGSQAIAVAGELVASLDSGTSNSGYGKARLARGLNSSPGYSGGGIYFSREIGISINMALVTASTETNVFRIIAGTGSGAPAAADSDPITDDGFGVEVRYDGTNTEWRVFGHNGTTLTTSAWTNLHVGSRLYPQTFAVYSNGSGTITAYNTTYGGNSYTTISTTGGPTTSGASATSYASAECVNSSTGTTSTRCKIYDVQFFTP